MRWRIQKDNGKYKLTAGAIIIIVVSSVVCLLLTGLGIGYAWLSSLSDSSVPIVTKVPDTAITPFPTADPNVVLLEHEPEDIDSDYDVQLLQTPEPNPIYYKQPLNEQVINILIIGTDKRPNETGYGRCDTMMLISYDTVLNRANIVSFLRDIWVPIEGHDYNRLNATYAFGGVGLTMNTINEAFTLDIQDYVIVDFEGMQMLIDKLGGIEVEITEEEAKYYNSNFGCSIEAGNNLLNGEMTLTHARNRKLGGGDFERTRRQRDIMLAIYRKISLDQSPETLSELLDYFLNHAQTNMSTQKLFSVAVSTFSGVSVEMSQLRIPIDGTWGYGNKDGRSVVVIDFNENREQLLTQLYIEE